MPYVIHMGRNHGQTKELLIALGQTQARGVRERHSEAVQNSCFLACGLANLK